MKQFFTLFFAISILVSGSGQPSMVLSDSAKISLMTVAPGEFVYSTFGHSAIRIKDPLQRFDRCYNYGTFEFEQPNFLLKFCRGKLLYNLDVETYRSFEYGNLQDRRPMKEQLFNMNQQEKQRLFDLLEENYKVENRYYKYDFFYDNCATRIRDILEEAYFHQIRYDSSGLPPNTTMRDLLHQYLQTKPWLGFGIDLVLGLPADQKATTDHFMFLPDYLHDIMGKAQSGAGARLVVAERRIPEHPMPPHPYSPSPIDRPLWVTGFIALLGLLAMGNPRTERVFDAIFWLLLGVAGLIITLLWFATDHSATKNNLNVFWALPTHLFYFFRNRRAEWNEFYYMITGCIAIILLIAWKWLPQELPVAAIPLVLLVVVKSLGRRYWKREKKEFGDETEEPV